MWDTTDAPQVVVLGKSHHRARKSTHKCMYCGRFIARGECYERQVMLVDGELETIRAHLSNGACADIEFGQEPEAVLGGTQ